MTHKHTVLGGTFDRIHDGHISVLKAAFEDSDRITIGLTTDKFNRDKELEDIIQPYDLRKGELLNVIQKRWPKVTVVIIPIDDIFGPSITDATLDSIVVTVLTLDNGKKVNEERVKRGLGELKIITVQIIEAQDNGILSSTRIRRGEINRNGEVYKKAFSETLSLPESLRSELRKPLGRVVKGSEIDKEKVATEAAKILDKEKYGLSIAVGDIVSATLKNAGFFPDIKIIDFKTQRKFLPSFEDREEFDSENIAGTISSISAKLLEIEIKKILKNKSKKTITIDGEEDLLVLPAILLAPLDSIVFYGLRGSGMVVVKVTEESKKQSANLIERFI